MGNVAVRALGGLATTACYRLRPPEIRVAPGGVIPSRCIVGIGSVVTGRLEGEYLLIAGVPAKPLKPLDEEDRFLVEHKTRPDMPDDL